MNELRKTTITTLEVAEMMEVEHWELLRKLDGRIKKDGNYSKGYIEILTDNHLVVSDFFIPSSYKDASGKENRCYEVTRLGCDFLANKPTGEKGVIFTARYVKRFQEMVQEWEKPNPVEIPIGEVASYLKAMDRVAVRQNLAPHRIAANFKKVSEHREGGGCRYVSGDRRNAGRRKNSWTRRGAERGFGRRTGRRFGKRAGKKW